MPLSRIGRGSWLAVLLDDLSSWVMEEVVLLPLAVGSLACARSTTQPRARVVETPQALHHSAPRLRD